MQSFLELSRADLDADDALDFDSDSGDLEPTRDTLEDGSWAYCVVKWKDTAEAFESLASTLRRIANPSKEGLRRDRCTAHVSRKLLLSWRFRSG